MSESIECGYTLELPHNLNITFFSFSSENYNFTAVKNRSILHRCYIVMHKVIKIGDRREDNG